MLKLQDKYPHYYVDLPENYSLNGLASIFALPDFVVAAVAALCRTDNCPITHTRMWAKVSRTFLASKSVEDFPVNSRDSVLLDDSPAGPRDVYLLAREVGVATNPELFHAFKKLLRLGKSEKANFDQDVQEAIDALDRFLEITQC